MAKHKIARFISKRGIPKLQGGGTAGTLLNIGEGIGTSLAPRDEFGVVEDSNMAGLASFFTPIANLKRSAAGFGRGDFRAGIGNLIAPARGAKEENEALRQRRDRQLAMERQEAFELETQGRVTSQFDEGTLTERPQFDAFGNIRQGQGEFGGLSPFKGGVGLNEQYFEHGGDPRYAKYHYLPKQEYNEKVQINVEGSNGKGGGELEVSRGKIITDYKSRPSHPKKDGKIDLFGDVMAKPGNVIVPKDKRKAYLEGDKITKNTIEAQLRTDQRIRDQEELQEFRGKRKHGGGVRDTPAPIPTTTALIPSPAIEQELALPKEIQVRDIMVGKEPLQQYIGRGENPDKVPGIKKAKKRFEKEYGKSYKDVFGTYKHGGGVRKYQLGAEVYDRDFFTRSDYNSRYPLGGFAPEGTESRSLVQPTTFDQPAGQRRRRGDRDFDRRGALSTAAQIAPAAFNIGMGLFGETPEADPIYNPRRDEVARLLREREVNLSPVLRDIELAEATGARSLRGVSGGNAALFATGRIALANVTQRSRSKARLEADFINQGYRLDEARGLAQLGIQEATADERARRLNLAFQANQAQFLPKGIEQVASLSERRETTRQEQDRNQILIDEYDRLIANAKDQETRDYLQSEKDRLRPVNI